MKCGIYRVNPKSETNSNDKKSQNLKHQMNFLNFTIYYCLENLNI